MPRPVVLVLRNILEPVTGLSGYWRLVNEAIVVQGGARWPPEDPIWPNVLEVYGMDADMAPDARGVLKTSRATRLADR